MPHSCTRLALLAVLACVLLFSGAHADDMVNNIAQDLPGVKTLTDETFKAQVEDSGQHTLVFFYAPWCAPCKSVAADVMSTGITANTNTLYAGKLTVAKLDAEKYPEIARKYEVSGYPTFILFSPGGQTHEVYGGEQSLNGFRVFIHRRILLKQKPE